MRTKTRGLTRGLFGVLSVVLSLTSGAQGALRTWTGNAAGDTRWSTPNNWTSGPPAAGDDLLFPGGGLHPNNNDDYANGTTFNSIIFSGTNYTTGGNSIALNAGILATNAGAANTVNNSLILNSNQTFTFNIGNASFFLSGPVNLNGNDLTLSVGSASMAQVQAVFSGPGGLLKTGAGSALLYGSNSFSGPMQILQGGVNIYDGHALGDTNGSTTVGDGAALAMANAMTVAEPLVLSGVLVLATGAKVLTGPLTLAGSNATIQVVSGTPTTVNGRVSGTNGFAKTGSDMLTLNADNPYTGTTTVSGGILQVNGSQPGSPILLSPGTLEGTGTVGTVTFTGFSTCTLAPGNGGPGILNCSNVTLNGVTTFAVQLNGTAAGNGYAQLNVKGSVALSNAVLSVTLGYAPAVGDSFVIIRNDASDPVLGTFHGLPEGAVFTNSGALFSISYTGGDGNDVVLYRGYPPARFTGITALPNGFKQIQGLGESNLTYTVQAAASLQPVIQWSNIAAAVANSSGVFSFTDTNAPQLPQRFYRAVSP